LIIHHCRGASARGRRKHQAPSSRLVIASGHILALVLACVLAGAVPAGAAGAAGAAVVANHRSSTSSPTSVGGSTHSPSALLDPLAGLLGALPGTHALPTSAWPGYWLASSVGGIGSYGGATFNGSLSGTELHAPVVGMAATPDGRGYWLAAADGGVFSFGDARFFGSVASQALNQQVVGIAATPDGGGYWLVAADGGVFSFGDATFFGSVGNKSLDQRMVGIASTPDGRGYWLVAADGGVFSFGDAPFFGSVGGKDLDQPIVGMAATPNGQGYWLVAADGGVFSFGDATFFGSAGGKSLDQQVVGIAAAPDGQGYWLAAADGGVFSFGSAPFRGSGSDDVPSGDSISALVSAPGSETGSQVSGDFIAPAADAQSPYAHGAVGYDISFPQCQKAYPARSAVAVVGVNDGAAFTTNPCFSSEAQWAGRNLTVYVNLNSPHSSDPAPRLRGPDGSCAPADPTCQSYNYGFNAVQHSMALVQSAGYSSHTWWLDVETSNFWSADTAANDELIAGALAAIRLAGDAPAIYSTDYQWNLIAGTYVPNVPAWYATGVSTFYPQTWCSGTSFAGGPVYLVQGSAGSYDGAYSC
jgi:hypothetical protein